MATKQHTHQSRREAKWQFRRRLLLATADILEKQSDQVWPQVSRILSKQMNSPSPSIQKSAKRWLRFAGKSPQMTIRVIRSQFGQDTPESPRRHKLQDLSDGHPFSGILPEETLEELRKETFGQSTSARK